LAAHIIFEQVTGKQLNNKIYVNVIEKTLEFNFHDAITACLSSSKLSKDISDIFIKMKQNKTVINCGPILTVVPFLEPKSVKMRYNVYGEVIREGEELNGLLAINWLKCNAKDERFC
jgi:hypothetical protein